MICNNRLDRDELNKRTISASVESQRRADELVNVKLIRTALADYYHDNREYPEDLSELKPKYISQVPSNPWGNGYEYKLTRGGDDYRFYFKIRDFVEGYYDSKSD